MRIIICDDEKQQGEIIEAYLREWFEQNQMEQPAYLYYSSGEELLEKEEAPDVVFLDVKMGGITGIDAGQKLKEKFPDVIIFMETSFLDYLDDAMRFHVFRYLTKPIDKERLFRNMEDAIQLHKVVTRTRRKIEMKTETGITHISMSEIVYIEARDQRTFVYTRTNEYTSWNTLHDWIAQLDMETFFQPHRSYLVNLEYVTHFDKTRIHLCDDQYTAYLAGRKYKEFKEAYFRYINRVW